MEDVITEESRVPAYMLPDPLTMESGRRVSGSDQWPARRAEILELFERHLYGRAPETRVSVEGVVISEHTDALEGRAILKQVELRLRNKGKVHKADVLILVPKSAKGPVPTFLGLSFFGNHTLLDDRRIRLPESWLSNSKVLGITDNRATDDSRGVESFHWPADLILERGFGLCSVYCGDFDPDFDDGFENGVHGLFTDEDFNLPPEQRWGTIAGWAWGLSRVVDYLETDPLVDASRVAVMGHSRLGKASLWAGATDPRFAAVISNNSGCGGAALFRRRFGERLARMNATFPHWLNKRSLAYNEQEQLLPVDQHQLIALMAPRPVYVASASEDLWADPQGEFLSLVHADPVFRLLTADGLPTKSWPEPEKPLQGRLSYHLRQGRHDIVAYDWEQYLTFAQRYLT